MYSSACSSSTELSQLSNIPQRCATLPGSTVSAAKQRGSCLARCSINSSSPPPRHVGRLYAMWSEIDQVGIYSMKEILAMPWLYMSAFYFHCPPRIFLSAHMKLLTRSRQCHALSYFPSPGFCPNTTLFPSVYMLKLLLLYLSYCPSWLWNSLWAFKNAS